MENHIIYYTPGSLRSKYSTTGTGDFNSDSCQFNLPNMFDFPSFIQEFNDLFNPYEYIFKQGKRLNIDNFNERSGIDKYPVSDIYIDKNNNLVYKIAVTDFSEDELNVYTENNKLYVEGTKKEREDDVQLSIHNRICRKDFKFSAPVIDGYDTNEISAEFKNGQITIKIPMIKEISERIKRKEIALSK